MSANPFSATKGHNSTRTAIIFVCLDSFIRVLTAKQGMLTLPPFTRSRDSRYKSGHSLSSYIFDWLLQQERLFNPGGLRWSPPLVSIVRTLHKTWLSTVKVVTASLLSTILLVCFLVWCCNCSRTLANANASTCLRYIYLQSTCRLLLTRETNVP